MDLKELKQKSPAELLALAEELQIENAPALNSQELMYSILKQIAATENILYWEGVLEVLSDGFGFLRSGELNYLAGPDDIYISPNQIRRTGLRTGDMIYGEIRPPKEGERYFSISKIISVNDVPPE